MFELNPFSIQYTFVCPDCNCKFGQPESVLFQGTSVLADCLCECCENRYYHTIPTGHAALFPVAFSQKTGKVKYDQNTATWLAEPLIASIREGLSVERTITKKVFKETKEIILLNCLDSCYGHVFLKLLNAQELLRSYPGKGLIVLIPSGFQWLLPDGIAELWEVEGKLKDFDKRIANLDAFIKEEIKRFDSASMSQVPVHPDLSRFELKDFLKTDKFELADFEKKPYKVTFIMREDRFWLNNPLDAFIQKAAVSKGWMKQLRPYFAWKQNRLFAKLAKEIYALSGGKYHFAAAGLGKTGSLPAMIKDLRYAKTDETVEMEWCALYASSHVVIGIHGSNMLIPTALSAGFVELLPRYKINNLTEDISMDHKGRYMQFLGRYLDEFSSVKLVATHVVSMLSWFPVVRRNMEEREF